MRFLVLFLKRMFYKKKLPISEYKIDILVNGPSLKLDLKKYQNNLSNILVVNQFVKHESFIILKPKYYLIQDPYFWDVSIKGHWEEKRNSTIESLNKTVTWKMMLIIPHKAKKLEKLIINSNIIFKYYHEIPLPDKIWSSNKYNYLTKYLLSKNIISPVPRNVLITAIYICIISNVKILNIHGADMSFFKELEVNQETNEVGIIESHFYGTEFFPLFSGKKNKIKSSLSDQLFKWSCVFKDLEKIAQLGHELGVDIYNRSSRSYIDFLKRKK
jgi:hypothetical protein